MHIYIAIGTQKNLKGFTQEWLIVTISELSGCWMGLVQSSVNPHIHLSKQVLSATSCKVKQAQNSPPISQQSHSGSDFKVKSSEPPACSLPLWYVASFWSIQLSQLGVEQKYTFFFKVPKHLLVELLYPVRKGTIISLHTSYPL